MLGLAELDREAGLRPLLGEVPAPAPTPTHAHPRPPTHAHAHPPTRPSARAGLRRNSCWQSVTVCFPACFLARDSRLAKVSATHLAAR